jgi:hypothetical protein
MKKLCGATEINVDNFAEKHLAGSGIFITHT